MLAILPIPQVTGAQMTGAQMSDAQMTGNVRDLPMAATLFV